MHLAHILLLHSTLIAGFAAPARAVEPRAQAVRPSESVELSATESAAMTVSTGGRRTVSELLERGREIRFDPGTSKLLEASLPFLDALATALVQDPAARLEIVVHTADSGDAKKDLTLSKRRAEAVKSMLVVKGASAAQLLATGRGSEDPVAPNLTRTGRLRNERVELHRASSPLPGA
jgi:outer membrane protein OmpA-like peptidoglycan-associated protein